MHHPNKTDRALRIPAEEGARSGLTDSHVKINDKYGGGFPANVQGLHNLHCLVCTPPDLHKLTV
jgi:Mycotoxin biosynthesis protein UstYa